MHTYKKDKNTFFNAKASINPQMNTVHVHKVLVRIRKQGLSIQKGHRRSRVGRDYIEILWVSGHSEIGRVGPQADGKPRHFVGIYYPSKVK